MRPNQNPLIRATNQFWRGRCTVYRCYSSAGRLLYVGYSADVPERLRQHRRSSPWFAEVDRIAVKVYRTSAEALAAELEAIRTEWPLHNVRHAPGWLEWRERRRVAA